MSAPFPIRVLTLAIALVVTLASTATGADGARATGATPPIPAPATPAAGGPASTSVRTIRATPPSALMRELHGVMENERKQVAALQARLADATDARAAMAIQREIEQVKAGTEIALLRIQSAHARRAGRTALADRIDAVIAEMQRPVPRGVPIARPAPTVPAR